MGVFPGYDQRPMEPLGALSLALFHFLFSYYLVIPGVSHYYYADDAHFSSENTN